MLPPLAHDDHDNDVVAAYAQLISDARNARTVALIAFTCLVWHHVTTLDKEAHFIWATRCRINGSLFVCMRYLTLASFIIVPILAFVNIVCRPIILSEPPLTPNSCHNSSMFTGSSSLIVIAICDFFLLIRVWAIYERRRLILILLLLGFVGTITPMFVLGVRWLRSISHTTSISTIALEGCFLVSPMFRRYWEIFPFTIAFNSVLVMMTVFKAWGRYRIEAGTPISTLILRDGAWSYLVVLVALLFTGCGVFIPRFQMIALQSGFSTSVITIVCSQMQLNIRDALEQDYVCTSDHLFPCVCGASQIVDDHDSHVSFVMPYPCREFSTSSPPPTNRRSPPPLWHKPECQVLLCHRSLEVQKGLVSPDSSRTRWDEGLRVDDRHSWGRSVMVSSTACQSSSNEDAGPPSPRTLGRTNTVPSSRTAAPVLPLFRSSSFSGSIRPPSIATLSATTTLVGRDSVTPTMLADQPLITGGRGATLQPRLEQRSAPGAAYYLQSLPLPIYSQGFMGPVGGIGFLKSSKKALTIQPKLEREEKEEQKP